METFLQELRGEIDIRSEYVEKIKNRASKFYLLIRNFGTMLTLIGFIMMHFGYSQWIMTGILCLLLFMIWLNDFLDYSIVILVESEFISTLNDVLITMTLTSKFTKIENVEKYIADQIHIIGEKRTSLMISAHDSRRRAERLMKKNV